MPELPEVETIARELRPRLIGRRVEEVVVYWPRAIASPAPDRFQRALRGRRITNVARRAKYLLMPLDGGDVLLIHLRMTGSLRLRWGQHTAERHTRVALWLDDGWALHFDDPRKFGRLWLTPDPGAVLGDLGPEPLEPAFTPRGLADRLRHRRAPIKAVLLDQRCVAGLGNIYADEVLFVARIDPRRPAGELSESEIRRLHSAIREVLAEAIRAGGSTLRDYRAPVGGQGRFQDRWRVYHRAGQPCPRCGERLVCIRLAQRSTHFCPRCQGAADAHPEKPMGAEEDKG